MPVVGLVGVLGNLGAILILMRPEMRSTFHHSLLALAFVDVIFVVTLIVDTQVHVQNENWIKPGDHPTLLCQLLFDF